MLTDTNLWTLCLVTTYFVSMTYFVLPDLFCAIFDLFRITDLFCSKIALFCITWPTYFVPTVDLICYKMVCRILTRFQGDTK